MENAIQDVAQQRPRPRLWPGVLFVSLQWFACLALPRIAPETALFALLGGVAGGGLAILLWWLFFSRIPWVERIFGLLILAGGLFATRSVVHPTIANDAPKLLAYLLSIPIGSLALVSWAFLVGHRSATVRRVSLPIAAALACSLLALLRTDGVSGDGVFQLHWRWTPTSEELLAASSNSEPKLVISSSPGSPAKIAWGGFRGTERDGIVHHGVQICTDWSSVKPVELWRRPIGPGWSSFAVSGSLIFTQEQRGEEEAVTCYDIETGRPVWFHRDPARFWESTAGPGPRGTPAVSDGAVYSFGATGIVNALNATDGKVIWSKNAVADTEVKVPDWGFAGSPLVVDDMVVIATGGRLVAYDRLAGARRWVGPKGIGGYSSPMLTTLNGVRQILLHKSAGVIGVTVGDGAEIWKYGWKGDGIVQAAVSGEGDVYLGAGSGLNPENGVIRLSVTRTEKGWNIAERWKSTGLKPYYSDFVLHKNHAYGFDGSILASISLADGKRDWKGGRYGHGQVLLLPDQDVFLVLSEAGVVALVEAKPEKYTELARFKAIEGKTWNHPVLIDDVLLVRNGEEMAAFRLPKAQ